MKTTFKGSILGIGCLFDSIAMQTDLATREGGYWRLATAALREGKIYLPNRASLWLGASDPWR